ncbi:hypothetical protein ACI4CD_29505, partial [Klebsiella pneumoniae]|uniref:hypothetical protein n=1 Tax=Klebsiella pneumoniae TaxID=573 RepID=UPI0038552912
DPAFCDLAFYRSLDDLSRWRGALAQADAVLLGSYVPQGVAVGALAFATARQAVHAFYDIDTPVTLRKLEAGDSEYLDPALAAR